MLELKHTRNEDALRGFCEYSNLLCADEFEAYAAYDAGETVGYCIFELGEALLLLDTRVEAGYGAALCDGLVRAVLDYACKRGVNRAEFAQSFCPQSWEQLHALGYTVKTVQNIDNFLTNCKNCAR